jgi:glyoxylase-like metal-dependent hydrolase (beta-lactamase superfamily II)
LVDTGDTWRNSVPGYLPWWNPFFTTQVEIKVALLEEIGSRLQAMGIDPARDISAVMLTHFRHDHTGGLDHFPHNRIIVPRESYEASAGLKGKMMGCLPQRWPIWFRPVLIAPDSGAEGPFPSIYPITKDGRIFMVPTPGHSKGHMSVVVRGPDLTYFLGGDATYSEANLRAEKADGVTNDPRRSIATLRSVATGFQRLGVRLEVTEAVLNHISGSRGGIAGVYQRHDWAVEKRAALEAWASHVLSLTQGEPAAKNVVALTLSARQ